jgi:hypothetical protein
MERGKKRVKKPPVYLLNLGDWIPQKDVRKLIWTYLNPIDKLMVWSAHGVHTYLKHDVYWFRRQLVRYGYLELLLWNTDGENNIVARLVYREKPKHLHMIKWIVENDFEHFDSIFISKYAAKRGYLNILKYIHSLGAPLNKDVHLQGTKGGHIEIVIWLKETEYNITDYFASLCIAVKNGHTEFLKWYLNQIDVSGYYYLYWLACKRNNYDVFKTLINCGFEFDKGDCLGVVVQGSAIHTWILNNT